MEILEIPYKNELYEVTVDVETANTLMNDPVAAEQYVEQLLELKQLPEPTTESGTAEICWKSSRTPTAQDVTATIVFLELRCQDKYEKLFNDKKTVKNKVWQMIASEMAEKGFQIGEGKEAAERCRQKYHNLLKTYITLTKTKTGTEHKNLPKYFDLMHKLFGEKHNVNPTFLMDSLSDTKIAATVVERKESTNFVPYVDDNLNVNMPSTSSTPTTSRPSSRASSVSTSGKGGSIKPKSNADKILDVIQKQHQEQMEMNKTQFQQFQKLLEEQNKFKREFLDIFKDINNRKRKRSNSDSD